MQLEAFYVPSKKAASVAAPCSASERADSFDFRPPDK